MEFSIKAIQQSNQEIIFQFWDIAGHDRFMKVSDNYYKNAIGAVVVFDCQDSKSLENAKRWKQDIDKKIKWNGHKLPVVLFANKNDLLSGENINNDQITQFCLENGFIGWYIHLESFLLLKAKILIDEKMIRSRTSAVTGEGIDSGMRLLADAVINYEQLSNMCLKEEKDYLQPMQMKTPVAVRESDRHRTDCCIIS